MSLASGINAPRVRGPIRVAMLGAAAGLLMSLIGGAVVFGLSMHQVSSSGICFAGPGGSGSTWPYSQTQGRLTLSYYLPPADGGVAAVYNRAATRSFQAWATAWPVFHFVRVRNVQAAQISVQYANFGRTGQWWNHAGLTIPDFQMFGCGLSHAHIEINNSYLVSAGILQYAPHFLRHLFAHEIGHALGLHHVYSPAVSVMVPTSNAYVWAKPQRYDIATVAALYPSATTSHLVAPAITGGRTGVTRWHSGSTFASKP